MRVEPFKCQRLQALSPECKRSTACFGAFYLVIFMNIEKWKSISGLEQTLFLESNHPINGRGMPRKPVYGAGFNDADYCQQPIIEGRRVACPAYVDWKSMIERAYGAKFHAKRPTYIGVTVCDEWHSFMSFRAWWLENQIDGYHLDKDLLSGGRTYSPDACIFIPLWLNNFTSDRRAGRGEWPIGASWHKASGRFVACCHNPVTLKHGHIGLFDTPEAAHHAWLSRKLELAIELKPKMDEIDLRIYHRVVEIIMKAR